MTGYNFTERVRKVCAMAREEADVLSHEYVGTEHLLLALIRDGEGVGYAVIANVGGSPADISDRVIQTVTRGAAPTRRGQDLPYTSRAKKALEFAMAEARELNHPYIGTEHLLLGLIRERSGIAAQILLEFGVDAEKARAETLRCLGPGPVADVEGDDAPMVPDDLPAPTCPDCSVEMEPGVLLDRQGHAVARWMHGGPSRGVWRSAFGGTQPVRVAAFRCRQCGYLRFTAGTG